MNAWPVITRELRAQSRQPFTHALRLLGVGALITAGGWFVANNAIALNLNQNVGRDLFQFLHTALFFSICLLVPFSAADCISVERREGTLGLLFLTPLRARDIVAAKAFTHGLRALGLVLCVSPVFAIPLLLGGVTWQQVAVAVFVNLSAVCVTLGAAVIASSWNRRWMRSLLMTFFLCWCASKVLMPLCGWLAVKNIPPVMATTPYATPINPMVSGFPILVRQPTSGYMYSSFVIKNGVSTFSNIGWSATGLDGLSGLRCRVAVPVNGSTLVAMAETFCLAGAFLLAAIWIASKRLLRVWREGPPSAQQVWIEKKFSRRASV